MARPAPWPEALPAALEDWQEQGLLSAAQAQAILKAEGFTPDTPQRRATNRWAVTVSALGALVLGLGVLALVGTNWQQIPGWGKLLLVLLPMLLSYLWAYRLRDDPRRSAQHLPGLGAALYLLGGVLFGALLALLAQGFQLGVETSTLLLLWGLGLLALGYAVRLPPALHLALPLGVVIPLTNVIGWIGLPWVGSVQQASALIAGVGLGMLALVFAHPRLGAGLALANPWAFWGPPLLLGGVYGLHLWRGGVVTECLVLDVLLALGVVWLGQRVLRRAWVNWGLVGVGVMVLTVYFQLLGTLAMTGLALVGAGLLLLALGWALERARRHLAPAPPPAPTEEEP